MDDHSLSGRARPTVAGRPSRWLLATGLRQALPDPGGILGRTTRSGTRGRRNLTLSVPGETLGVVGESGCAQVTVAAC